MRFLWLDEEDFDFFNIWDRLGAGTRRFIKGFVATVALAGIDYIVVALQNEGQTLIPPEYAFMTGALVSALLAVEKMLQKAKK